MLPLMVASDSSVTAKLTDYIVFLIRCKITRCQLPANALRLIKDLRNHVSMVLSLVNG